MPETTTTSDDLADGFADLDMKAKQAAYHDYEAQTYEGKFGITYDQRCIDYAVERFRKVTEPHLGPDPKVFGRVLEVGAGTGFFCINLFLGGKIGGEVHATDISEGMLAVCKRNGAEHGLDIHTKQGDAEDLPYEDDSFDLVMGHAFIHHLPVPGLAIREMLRVLKPGGILVIAGEPTRWGDRLATYVKRGTWRTFRAVTALPGLRGLRRPELDHSGDPEQAILAALEHEVDLHEFRPDEVAHMAEVVGFEDVNVVTEELTANWLGWSIRTLEGSMRDGVTGMRWNLFAYNGYLRLTWLDEKVFEHLVPKHLFYNLILFARKPGGRDGAVTTGSGAAGA